MCHLEGESEVPLLVTQLHHFLSAFSPLFYPCTMNAPTNHPRIPVMSITTASLPMVASSVIEPVSQWHKGLH